MSSEQIIEGNKLIAGFMGIHITPIGLRRNVMQRSYFENELSYHNSWDWLMPVVETIESLGYQFKICRKRVEIRRDCAHETIPVVFSKFDSKISSIWSGCVEFIKWYKLNKPSNDR